MKVGTNTGRLGSVARPRLFEASLQRGYPRGKLFALNDLGGACWLSALRLRGYVPIPPRSPQPLQQTLFTYTEAP